MFDVKLSAKSNDTRRV